MTLLALEVIASEASERQAASLIKRDRIKNPSSWDAPSAEKENEIIESKGWEVYGRWFLGREDNADPESKAAYKYPYTSDFANVDYRGLVAIRQRAGQAKEQTIFDAAGRLMGLIEEPEPVKSSRTPGLSSFRIAFRKTRKSYEVDADRGIISDVSLIQVGEAKGHGIYIDETSLDSALVALGEANLPAYVTHAGAIESDRLLNEIGVFSDFFVEDGKLKAKKFKALDSFMGDDATRFRRLFDLANEAPDAFGISLVFDADLVWVTEDGDETPISDGDGDKAIRKLPSVRFNTISSADFVDAPAANDDGLFQSIPEKSARSLRDVVREEIKLQEDLTMADEESKQEDIILEEVEEKLEESAEEESAEEETAEEGKLDIQEEVDKLRDDIGAHDTRLNELEDGIADLKKEVLGERAEKEELAEKNEALTALIAGSDPIEPTQRSDNPIDSNLIDRFNAATGVDQTILWNENKQAILASYSRGE